MIRNLEPKLLITARVLVTLLPLFLIGGRLAVEACISLTAILFIVRSTVSSDWSWLRRTWLRIGFALWVWMLFISNFALDAGLSYGQALPWVRFLLFAAALEAWVLNEVWMRRVLWVATGVVLFTALDTWLQFFLGSDLFGNAPYGAQRLTGPFDRPRVGIFLAKLMFPVLCGAFAWRLWHQQRLAAGTLFLLMVVLLLSAIFISGERMAMLLALLGLMIMALLQQGALRRALIGVMAVVLSGAVLMMLINPALRDRHVSQTMETVTHMSESHYGRIWTSTAHLVMQHPWTGVGMKNFRVACPALDLPLSVEERCATHPHNLYLEWWSESGSPGLLLFLALVLAWARDIARGGLRMAGRAWLLGPAVALAVQLWPLGPTGSFFSNWSGGLFWLAVGWALAAARLRAS